MPPAASHQLEGDSSLGPSVCVQCVIETPGAGAGEHSLPLGSLADMLIGFPQPVTDSPVCTVPLPPQGPRANDNEMMNHLLDLHFLGPQCPTQALLTNRAENGSRSVRYSQGAGLTVQPRETWGRNMQETLHLEIISQHMGKVSEC